MLAVLTVLGTAPVGTIDQVSVPTPVGDVDLDSATFAELFEEMRAPETAGEGVGAVAVAAAPPELPAGPAVAGAADEGVADGSDSAAEATTPTDEANPGGADPGSADPAAEDGAAAAPGLPEETPEPAAATVQPVQPRVVVRGVDPAMVGQIAQAEGVAAAASATVGAVTVEAPDGPREVTVAAVDPVAFRPLTPEITAAEAGVWDRIAAGDAAFTHDAGNRLAVPLGATVTAEDGEGAEADPLGTTAGTGTVSSSSVLTGAAIQSETAPVSDGLALRIGALASNGIPPVADALVSTQTGAALGVDGPADVYVALADGADSVAVEQELAALTGAAVEALEMPETQTNTFGAFLVGADARNFFEPFDYIDHGDGLITIDPDWVSRNIASTRMMPVLNGTVTCHRQMLIQMYGALSEVEAAGLSDLIDTSQYGGCWVARHIDFNPSKPISMHGWGLAVDLNVSTNGLGQPPTMDPRIVEIFDRWGFVWGGRWSRPDGMHFEIGAVVDVPVPDGFFAG